MCPAIPSFIRTFSILRFKTLVKPEAFNCTVAVTLTHQHDDVIIPRTSIGEE